MTCHANCLEMSDPVFWKNKKKNVDNLSAELAQKVITVKAVYAVKRVTGSNKHIKKLVYTKKKKKKKKKKNM